MRDGASEYTSSIPRRIRAMLEKCGLRRNQPITSAIVDRINEYPHSIAPSPDVAYLRPASRRARRSAARFVLDGRLATQFLFAGAATRAQHILGSSPKFFLNGADWDKQLLDLTLGERQLVQFRMDIEALAKHYGTHADGAVRAQFIVVHIGENAAPAILDRFVRRRFFGFDPARVIFYVQDSFPGYAVSRAGRLIKMNRLRKPYGHGYTLMQLGWPKTLFTMNRSGQRRIVRPSGFDFLIDQGVQMMRNCNIDDLSMLDQVVDLNRLSMVLGLMQEGYNVVVEGVQNKKGQKGGIWVRDQGMGKSLLIEMLQLRAKQHDSIFMRHPPLNRMANYYRLPAVRTVLREQMLPSHLVLTERNGRRVLYLEMVTGDITQLDGIKPAVFIERGNTIHTFKDQKDIYETLKAMETQEGRATFRKLAQTLPPLVNQ